MANKKINQLVSKTSILGTDLFPLGDGTTGQLFKKTVAELQAAIGGAVISVNGLVGTVVLDTDDIQELPSPTNRYFTDARARGAISLTVSGASGASTYNSSTGVLNVPTYTLAGLGGITASFLSGGTGITYNSGTGVIAYSGTVYTDSSIRGLFSGGTGITYNSSTGAISYSGTVYTDSSIRGLFSGSTGISYNSTTGAISSTITQYTDALARASISLTTTGTSGASTYNSTTGVLNIPQYQAVLTNPITGTGTTNYVTKWTSSSAVGNSQIFDNGTNVGIGTTSPSAKLNIQNAIGSDVIRINDAGGNVRLTIGQEASFTGNYINSTNIDFKIQSYFASGSGGNIIFQTQSNGTASVVERMRISSVGQILVGTSTNSGFDKAIVFNSVSSTSGLLFQLNGVDKGFVYSGGGDLHMGSNSNNVFLYTNGLERMRIAANGNVGIGTTSPINVTDHRSLTINAPSISRLDLFCNGTSTGLIFAISSFVAINTITAIPLVFITNNVDQGRITSGGNWLLGTDVNNGERLYVSGSIRATGTITANSDITLKKNLAKIENALEKVEQINGYTYEFKADDSKRHAGVIAQEIEGVLPEIVNKGADGILGVEYGNISALLIEAIKEQQKKIQELEVKLIALGQ